MFGFNLTPAAKGANVWRKAFESQLTEQKMFDNVAFEVAKFFTRIAGWLSMDVALYTGANIASKRKKRDDEDDLHDTDDDGSFWRFLFNFHQYVFRSQFLLIDCFAPSSIARLSFLIGKSVIRRNCLRTHY